MGFIVIADQNESEIEGIWLVKSSGPDKVIYEIDKDIYGIYEIQIWQIQSHMRILKSISKDIQFDPPNLSVSPGYGEFEYCRLKLDATARKLDGRLIHHDGGSENWNLIKLDNMN